MLSLATHESLDLKETAYIVANDGRRLMDDRVSVAIKKEESVVSKQSVGKTRLRIVPISWLH